MESNNYVVIQGWMCNELELKGNNLLVFALIYGFSQDGQSRFFGSRNYIAQTFNISLPTDTAGDGVFKIVEGGKLTINGEGVINGVGNNDYSMAIWVNGGECVINGGTYTNEGAGTEDHYDLIYVKGGKLTINGGTFKGQTPAWLVNTHDGHRDTSTIVITGGTFYGFNPANNATENAGTNYVANGYIVVERDDVYTLETSLEKAMADENVSEITLATNVELNTVLIKNNTFTDCTKGSWNSLDNSNYNEPYNTDCFAVTEQ